MHTMPALLAFRPKFIYYKSRHKKCTLYQNISRTPDNGGHSSETNSVIFDIKFLGPLPWEEIHKLEDDYFKSKDYCQLFSSC